MLCCDVQVDNVVGLAVLVAQYLKRDEEEMRSEVVSYVRPPPVDPQTMSLNCDAVRKLLAESCAIRLTRDVYMPM